MSYFRDHGPYPYSYQQAHLPVREQKEAVGHAVREVYMTSALADVGGEADPELLEVSRRLYQNIVETQMSVTGGIGSMCDGEAFTFPYDLPNDRCYNETCASIGLIMTSQRLLNLDRKAGYADVLETALYNNMLAGVSLDGTKFFYVNPMEVWPKRNHLRQDMNEILTVRQGWYGCACCPPNLLRTLFSLGQYIYSLGEKELYVNLFIGSEAVFEVDGCKVRLKLATDYPRSGLADFTIEAEKPVDFTLCLRIPGWCGKAELTVNENYLPLELADGYARLARTFRPGDRIRLDLEMKPEFLYCDDRVPYDAGKVALRRGPVVYCAEEKDNGSEIWNLTVNPRGPVDVRYDQQLLGGVYVLSAEGARSHRRNGPLYSSEEPAEEAASVTWVPYYSWGNRGEGEMSVWLRTDGPDLLKTGKILR